MSEVFRTPPTERLREFLAKTDTHAEIEQLTPDASTREFFRLRYPNQTAIACVYPEKIDETLPQIDVTNLFQASDLPVAKIFEVDYDLGLLVHEDFGDQILRDVLEKSNERDHDELLKCAISLIAKIQYSTPKALEVNSIASKLKFDEEKLLWELNFFKQHYFGSLKNTHLSADLDMNLTAEFVELSRELEGFAKVLTHRDFHAANLMLDSDGELKIIDHQDARIGSIAYDLVSLLLDRITEIPSQEWLAEQKAYFLSEREKLGFENIPALDLDYEFDLMTVQRCLKAIGTFANQAGNFGKTEYVQYIQPMFLVVLNASERIDRFPVLQEIIHSRVFSE